MHETTASEQRRRDAAARSVDRRRTRLERLAELDARASHAAAAAAVEALRAVRRRRTTA